MGKTFIQAARPRAKSRVGKPAPKPVAYDPSAGSFDLAMAIGLGGGVPTSAVGTAVSAARAVAKDSPAAEEFRARLRAEAARAASDRALALASALSPEKPYVAIPAAEAHAAAETRQASGAGNAGSPVRAVGEGGGASWDFLRGDGKPEKMARGANAWGGNLRNDGRAARLNLDDQGKVTGYSTTESAVVRRGDRYYVIPTMAGGKTVENAERRFDETNEYWGVANSATEADALAKRIHEHHAKRYAPLWHEYALSHWDDMADGVRNDEGLKDRHDARGYVGGLDELTRLAYDTMVRTPHVEMYDRVGRLDTDGKPVAGHGAHFRGSFYDKDGRKPVKVGDVWTWRQSAEQFATDVSDRDRFLRERFAVPKYDSLPTAYKVALIDIAFGKDGQLTERQSPTLFRKLRTARDEAELKRAIEEEYHTYGANVGATVRNRRIAVAKRLFGKTLKYRKDRKGRYRGSYETRQDALGGDTGGNLQNTPENVNSDPPVDNPANNGGPRIVVNPTTFRNGKDALCVAFNERFRIAMEQYGWEPKSEPTGAQRRFFADTAYADDEVMLRRTIIARILTLDTSIS